MHWYLEPGFDTTSLLVLAALAVIGAALVAVVALRRPVAATRRALDVRLARGEIDTETYTRMSNRLRNW